MRKLNNFSRRFRLGKVFNALPREFKDYITTEKKNILRISLALRQSQFGRVIKFFARYHENQRGGLEQVQANLNKNLNVIAVYLLKSFLKINSLIVHAKFDEIKQRIIRKIELDF